MSALWTIRYNGVSRPFAQWGVRRVKRQLINQFIDYLTLEQPSASFDSAPLFAEGGTVELFRAGERWFYGRAEDVDNEGDPRHTGFKYAIAGPWWWLEVMGFRQSWKFRASADDSTLTEKFTSVVLLGTTITGQSQSVGDQIAEAVNYAIEQGAPMALDTTGLPTLTAPVSEAWNESVANVIRTMLRWAPDTVAAFDYSTEPYPTLRFRRRSETGSATRVTLPALDERLIQSLRLRARNDLKVPGVVIYYLRTDTANGAAYTSVAEDAYPPATTGREPKALVAAINLEGANVTYAAAPVTCLPILHGTVEWWKARRTELKDYDDVSIEPIARTGVLPREFVGQYAGWMGGAIVEEEIAAYVSYVAKDEDQEIRTVSRQKITVRILTTNLITRTYYSTPSGIWGESQPIGLAQALYNATKATQFDGAFSLKEEACSGMIGMGDLVNLAGGRAEWATMDAQVQQISEDIDTGTTNVIVGPPKQLGPDDYMELLRATRWRVRLTPVAARSTGVGAQSGSAILGDKFSKEVHGASKGGVIQTLQYDPSGELDQRINSDLRHLPPGTTAQFQKLIYYKKVAGVCKPFKRYFQCTEEQEATSEEAAAELE